MANIRNNLQIDSPTEKIYNAITTQEGLRAWWTGQTEATGEIGSIIHFQFGEEHYNKMLILELNEAKEVRWECVDASGKEWVGTQVHFELVQIEEGKTFLKFSHLGWQEETEFFGLCSHHWSRYLDSLKSLCETGQGNPYINQS